MVANTMPASDAQGDDVNQSHGGYVMVADQTPLVAGPTNNRQDPDMTKLIAALMAALFAVASVSPTFAAEEKKDAKKEQKKDEKKAADKK